MTHKHSKHVQIPYGSRTFEALLPYTATVLSIIEPEQRMSIKYFAGALRDQLQYNALKLDDTIIIVADKTRTCGYSTYLPVLIDVLKEYGLQEDRLRFIIAYGTHTRQSDAECRANYGETYSKYPFIHHDCTDSNTFTDYGVTSRGVPIRLRRDIVQAGCVITMGPICHHYFAGYGGGRKLIFPGCGEREAIYANHSLYLDKQNNRLSPGCRPGVLVGNPLAEDLFEIAEKKEADLAIHSIMNSRGEVCDIRLGSNRTSYLEASEIHARLCESSSAPFAVVIASCGGYPKDINFIQSHKAIHNASMFVRDGGTLLLFAECRDSIGSKTFLPWYEKGGFDEAFRHLCREYEGNGGTALAMMAKTRRIRIAMVTELEEDICARIDVEKWSSSEALRFIHDLEAPAGHIGYIANAGLLVHKVQ
ncbi:MAG: nickel-dependent lactate racemase [Desulfopila sp.]